MPRLTPRALLLARIKLRQRIILLPKYVLAVLIRGQVILTMFDISASC